MGKKKGKAAMLSSSARDVLSGGLSLIDSLDVAELDARIAWLEDALAAWRTLRAVKEVMLRRPAEIEPPWESAVDTDRKERMAERVNGHADVEISDIRGMVSAARLPSGKLRPGTVQRAMRALFLKHPGGLTADEVADATGINPSTVYAEFKDSRNYERLRRGKYALRNHDEQRNPGSPATPEPGSGDGCAGLDHGSA